MKKYIILAPADTVSGGPELAHQLCYEINSRGHEAYMYYVYENSPLPADVCAVEKFEKYNTPHVVDFSFADAKDNIVIVPEGLASFSFIFKNATLILWWMSVDNYLPYENIPSHGFLELSKIISMHLVQSEYARDYLLKKGIQVSSIMNLSDYISQVYKQFIYPAMGRNNFILFNPKKGYENIKPLIEKATWAKWIPLMNLTEEEMVLYMQMAKVYIDFGNHPGKDRIPREAASCGDIVITNTKGSAAFYKDVPIPDEYKFSGQLDYNQLDLFLHDCCDNYETRFHDFDYYRDIIKKDHEIFSNETAALLNYFKDK